MNDDFEEMSRAAGADAKAGLNARVDRERRLQTRSRRIRTICRFVILIAGPCGLGLLFLGLVFQWGAIAGLGCWLILPTMIAATVLFFMGGLAPLRVRPRLTQRERDRLDQ
jgi:hypothetical protein